MVDKISPRNTKETAEFIRNERANPSKSWKGRCLELQRTARGLPAVHPSALSAALATPEEDRVYKIEDLRRGMVAYSDDPNDSNPYGHTYFIAGRSVDNTIWTWSNDVDDVHNIGLVPLSFYDYSWGDKFMFGAISLNGYDLLGTNGLPVAKPGHDFLGKNYEEAIKAVKKAISYHKTTGNARLVAALRRDLAKLILTKEKFSKPSI